MDNSTARADKPARKLLFITLEPISQSMAGPAIRCVELARQLAGEFDVTVFSPARGKGEIVAPTDMKIIAGGKTTQLYEQATQAKILFIQANVLKTYPALARLGKFIVVDLYDPYLFSLLVQYQDEPVTASSSYRLMHQVLEKHMLAADFSLCASERQRDYWLGRFCALGRVDPQMYAFDPSLRKLIDVVPFGLSAHRPNTQGHRIKGVIKGIAETDRVLIWGGGIWDWFDPLTVIKAVAKLRERRADIKLFFMGTKSPNPQVPLMDMAKNAQKLAADLGLLDKHVFFSDRWIDYEERASYLLDADIAVSAHFDLIETRFSFRTRILDYLWAGLPILTTGGDQLAEMIDACGAGFALPYGDEAAWAEAIERILSDSALAAKCRASCLKLSEQFVWNKVAEPLRRFCQKPYHLPKFTRVTMPSLLERAHAVYSRGGTDLILSRSKEILKDLLHR